MTTTIELATVPSADTPGTCLYVHHDKHSYLFGHVPEGTQRALNSRKIRFGGTEHVFLSGPVGWDQMGGLMGYLLSIGAAIESAEASAADMNDLRREAGRKLVEKMQHSGVCVHGGDNICHMLAACRPVIMRQAVRVRACELRADPRAAAPAADDATLEPDWKDDAIRVWKIPVRKARSSSPPKRPHSSIDDADDGGGGGGGGSGGPAAEASSPPHRAALSDPDVAAMIIEKCMFNGKLKSGFFLQPRKVGELAPAQAALVKENGVLRLYRHGQDSLSPESNVFVFPGPDDKAAEDKRSGSLPINHHALPPTCYGQTSVSYVVKCHDRRGTFKPDEATRLGVTKRYYRDLIAGKSVQGADGKTVLPEMVMGAPKPGKGFVVADIPGPDYVDGFMERAEWKNAGLMENIVSFYWILGPGLSHDARIHAFIKQHGGARHVFCAQDTCPNMIVHPGAADLQVRLRQIDPERYPVARYDNSVRYPQPPPESPIVLGRAGEKMQLMPR
ncbi:hypothetical protein CDD83_771 [Cordyceps sp. RAO-2017]|nr:hypothetical protein CDD83_771 [Cordyceps sp. RAO-2017]